MKKFLSRFASKTALDQADFWAQRWKHQADYAVQLRQALAEVLRAYLNVRINEQGYAKQIVADMPEVELARKALKDERPEEATPQAPR